MAGLPSSNRRRHSFSEGTARLLLNILAITLSVRLIEMVLSATAIVFELRSRLGR
jgi:hypothetical protein